MTSHDPIPIAPNPIPEGPVSVLLFGGSFDPVHRAHATLPLLVRDAIGADLLLYVPAGRSPFKTDNPRATGAQRVEMLSAGLAGSRGVAISTIELQGEDDEGVAAPSYTVDTLDRLSEARPEASLRLLIGADQARSFHKWREADRILDLAPPCVMLRPGEGETNALLRALDDHWDDATMERWRTWLAPIDTEIDASSTAVRSLLEARDPGVASMLPEGVLEIIERDGLYRSA